jgi:hypothetical protein
MVAGLDYFEGVETRFRLATNSERQGFISCSGLQGGVV